MMRKFLKGFTLVEFLIVIVVIAILTLMISLAVEEFALSARATVIINNLNSMKKAVNLWYLANNRMIKKHPSSKAYLVYYEHGNTTYKESPVQEFWELRIGSGGGATYRNADFRNDLLSYIDGSERMAIGASEFTNAKVIKDGGVDVKTHSYRLNDDDAGGNRDVWFVGYVIGEDEQGLKRKFAERAQSAKLLNSNKRENNGYTKPYTNGNTVWMIALEIDSDRMLKK